MIYYIVEKNNKLDFQNPLDVENPFSFNLKLITPLTKIYLVDFTKINNEYIVKSSLQKSALMVVKSICNLYPNIIFSLNEEFWRNEDYRLTLLKTCKRTLFKRDELKNNSNENSSQIIKFKEDYLKQLEKYQIGDKNEIELV